MTKNIILLLVMLGANHIFAQEISISSDLNIRSYFSYDILGEINDRVLIYRDKGFVQEIDVFNENLVQIMTPSYIADPESPKIAPRDNAKEVEAV